MMLENKDGTFNSGPLDILCILHDETTDRYHAAFFEEHPLPGEIKYVEETNLVRLKSKMHHTEGSDTLEGALIHLEELSKIIIVPKENIRKDPIDWNGNLGTVLLLENWKTK